MKCCIITEDVFVKRMLTYRMLHIRDGEQDKNFGVAVVYGRFDLRLKDATRGWLNR